MHNMHKIAQRYAKKHKKNAPKHEPASTKSCRHPRAQNNPYPNASDSIFSVPFSVSNPQKTETSIVYLDTGQTWERKREEKQRKKEKNREKQRKSEHNREQHRTTDKNREEQRDKREKNRGKHRDNHRQNNRQR